MSRTVSMLLIGAVLLVGCSNKDDENEKTDNKTAGSGGSNTGTGGVGGSDSDECNPIGTWQATVTTTTGDCFPEGVSEEMTIDYEQSDFADLDKVKCQYEKSGPYHTDETEEDYEYDGTLTLEITFDGDSLSGSGKLESQLLESGEPVDSCEQSYTVKGSR